MKQRQHSVANGILAYSKAGFAVAAIAVCVAGCSSGPQKLSRRSNEVGAFPEKKYGAASPRVVADGEEVPKGGGRYQVGKAYSVAGRTYVPREMNGNYSAIGLASWYGEAFHGRRTSNGEVYDKSSISAAHPTMPLPSYARVTNLSNGRSMIVRVNDRGPFHGGRVMDVSQRVAEALEFKHLGTARIKVEHMAPAGLAGSDDRKLLASLSIDNKPATLPGLQPLSNVQVASAEPAFTSIPAARAALPVSRPAPQQLASRATEVEAGAEEEQTYQSVADAESEAPAKLASAVRAPLPARGVPLPPERPFDFGTIPDANRQISSVDDGSTAQGVPNAKLASYVAAAGRHGNVPTASKVSYFAPQPELSGSFGTGNPFGTLDSKNFVARTSLHVANVPSAQPGGGGQGYVVAVGVFQNAGNAQRIVKELGVALQPSIQSQKSASGFVFIVKAGPFAESSFASDALRKAHAAGAPDARIVTR